MPFNMFPYSNLHNINADWLLKKVKKAAEDAQEAAEAVAGYDAQFEAVTDELSALDGRLDTAETAITGKVDKDTGTAKDLKILRDLSNPNYGAALVADTTYASGAQTERLAIKQVTNNAIQNDLRRVAIGNPREASDATTKDYVDTALLTKVNKSRPVVFDNITIAQENNQNGVQIQLIGGSPYAAAVHPVSGGSVDTTTYARLGVGTPTADGQATPKKYVDDADAAKVDIDTGHAKDLKITRSTDGATGEALLARTTTVSGVQTERLEVRAVEGGTIQNSLRRVAAGEPLEDTDLATKKYTDDNKVGKTDPVMNNPVKIIDPSTNNGVGVTVVGGPVWGAAFHPISNGVINNSADAPISVGTPTSNNHAATKAYVDLRTPNPPVFKVVFSGTTLDGNAACDKTWQEVVNALTDGKTIKAYYQDGSGANYSLYELNVVVRMFSSSYFHLAAHFIDIQDLQDIGGGYTRIRCLIKADALQCEFEDV